MVKPSWHVFFLNRAILFFQKIRNTVPHQRGVFPYSTLKHRFLHINHLLYNNIQIFSLFLMQH